MRISNGILFEVKETDIEDGCFTVPVGVHSIADFAFRNCASLTSIAIPEGVETIGNFAFSGCVNLECITIPSGVIGIGASAFKDCLHLSSVVFTNDSQLSLLADDAFCNCYSLMSLELPEIFEEKAPASFRGCPAKVTYFKKKKPSLEEQIVAANSKKKLSLEDLSDEKLHEALHTKLSKELVKYYNSLLKLPTQQALSHAYEYASKCDIVAWVNNTELAREQSLALLKTKDSLNKIFLHYHAQEADHMAHLGRSIEMVADAQIERSSPLLKKQQEK